MQTLFVASRKGLFVIRGEGKEWKLAAHHFAGDPVTQVLADPRRSTDQGASWTDVGTPAFPTKPTSGPLAEDPTPWNVDLIWSLVPGGKDEPAVMWAGCMPAGLFKSEDSGQTWKLNKPLWEDSRRLLWMGGGNDYPGMLRYWWTPEMHGVSAWQFPAVAYGRHPMAATPGP